MQKKIQRLALELGKMSFPVLQEFKVTITPGMVKNVTQGVKHLSMDLVLSNASDLKKLTQSDFLESLALRCNIAHVSSYRSKGYVKLIYSLPSMYHMECLFAQTIEGNIGQGESFKQIGIDYFKAPQTLIAGITGSGKNVTAEAMTLATLRTEPNTKIVLIDPERQFGDFQNALALGQPIGRTDTEIDRCLDYAFNKLEERRRIFEKETPASEPRILVVVDEAQDCLKGRRAQIVKTIATRGRKWRVNTIVISQKPTEKDFSGILSQLGHKLVGYVSSARISSDLTGHPGLHCHKLSGNGEFLQVTTGDPVRFQVGFVQPGDYDFIERGDQSFSMPKLTKMEDVTKDKPVVIQAPEGEKQAVGRPNRKVIPSHIAYYMYARKQGKRVKLHEAKNILGLCQAAHYENQSYADEVIEAMKILEEKEDSTNE